MVCVIRHFSKFWANVRLECQDKNIDFRTINWVKENIPNSHAHRTRFFSVNFVKKSFVFNNILVYWIIELCSVHVCWNTRRLTYKFGWLVSRNLIRWVYIIALLISSEISQLLASHIRCVLKLQTSVRLIGRNNSKFVSFTQLEKDLKSEFCVLLTYLYHRLLIVFLFHNTILLIIRYIRNWRILQID